jgi:undecaprenyl-diphosphatase
MVFPGLTALERELLTLIVLESELMISLAAEVSALGSTVVAAIVVAGLWHLGDREAAEELFFSLVTVNIFVGGMKSLVSRPRPQEALAGSFTHSFPSGHAATAFLMATLLSERYPRAKEFFYGAAVLVAVSRLLIGVHYPSDVLAGAFLGWVIGWTVNNRDRIRSWTGKPSF